MEYVAWKVGSDNLKMGQKDRKGPYEISYIIYSAI
jgi:hypothetical protein